MIAGFFGIAGWKLGGWRLALLSVGFIVYSSFIGEPPLKAGSETRWDKTMVTLSAVLVSVPIAASIGGVLGVFAAKRRRVEEFLNPLLNLTQAMPHFTFMIPIGVFIGLSHKAGVIATIAYAMPPMARLTILGIQGISKEVVEAGTKVMIELLEEDILKSSREKDGLTKELTQEEETLREHEETQEQKEREVKDISKQVQELLETVSKLELKRSEISQAMRLIQVAAPGALTSREIRRLAPVVARKNIFRQAFPQNQTEKPLPGNVVSEADSAEVLYWVLVKGNDFGAFPGASIRFSSAELADTDGAPVATVLSTLAVREDA